MMKCRTLLTSLLLSLSIVAGGAMYPALAQDQPPLQRQMMIIAELFPGTYDNMEQVYFDNRLNLPEAERHQRVRSEVRRIPGARFGDHAFFILDYWYEQERWHPRIYTFHIDEAENAIRMKLHAFAGFDRTPYLKAHEDPSLLDDLSLEQLTHLPECDLFWRRAVGGFHANMRPKACIYEQGGHEVYADYQMMLNDQALWKGDVIRRLADDVQVNDEPVVLHQQNRARFFTCSMTFEEGGEITRFPDLRIMDQGGIAWVQMPTAEHPDREVAIRIRNVRWAMNNSAVNFTNDSFVMYLDERVAGEQRNVAYAWSTPQTPRMGINLHWLQAHCSLRPLKETRPYLNHEGA